MEKSEWTETLVHLLSLALRLESEGRVGRHEEFGVVSIKQQVKLFRII